MVNNCLLTAYWRVGISLPLWRGREVGQSGSSVCSRLRQLGCFSCLFNYREREAEREEGKIKARQRGRRGREDKQKKKGRQKNSRKVKKLKEMREEKKLRGKKEAKLEKRQAVEAKRDSGRMRIRTGSRGSRDRETN